MKTKFTRMTAVLLAVLFLIAMFPMQAFALDNGGTGGSDVGELDWTCVSGTHYYDEGVVTTAPTCTTAGVKTYTCTECGATRTEPVDATGHTWGDWTVTSEATCTEAGSKTHTCSVCGANEVEAIPATGHAWGEWTVTTEPTCTNAGEETRVCANDSTHTETRPVDALGHDYQAVVTAPTCTEQGYTTHTCSHCGDSYVDTYVDALGHTWGDWTVTSEATCTEAGSKTRTCSVCGANEVEAIPATGHAWGEWTVTTEPTCTNAGEETRVCANDSTHTETRPVDALGHDYQAVVTAPTCTEQGYTTHTCSHCGDSYVDTYVDALGHTWGEWEVVTAATCTTNGEKTHTCSVCGTVENEPIPMTGHTMEAHAAVDADCDNDGNSAYWYCSACNKYFSDAEGEAEIEEDSWIISALGHVWVAWQEGDDIADFTLKTAATTESAAVYYKNCSRCGESAEGIDESETFTYGEPLAPAFIYGDADGDGSVTSADAILLNQYFADVVTLDDLAAGADVDGDGSVTSADAILLNQYFADVVTLDDFGPQA